MFMSKIMPTDSVDDIIRSLGLEKHVEGGFYKPSFQSDIDYDEKHLLWSSIYFLLRTGEVSHFHRLTADELWYFHGGDSLTIYMINPAGELTTAQLGMNLQAGDRPQVLVPRGYIFGATMLYEGFSLVGCMVAPGFTFADFELLPRGRLLREFPQHREIIHQLSRD